MAAGAQNPARHGSRPRTGTAKPVRVMVGRWPRTSVVAAASAASAFDPRSLRERAAADLHAAGLDVGGQPALGLGEALATSVGAVHAAGRLRQRVA